MSYILGFNERAGTPWKAVMDDGSVFGFSYYALEGSAGVLAQEIEKIKNPDHKKEVQELRMVSENGKPVNKDKWKQWGFSGLDVG